MEGYLALIITSDSHIYIQCGLSVNPNHQQSCMHAACVYQCMLAEAPGGCIKCSLCSSGTWYSCIYDG